MYKKIIFTKSATQNMSQMNDLAREEIKKFLALNGWTLQEDLSNACNYCLTKNFSAQENSPSNELNDKVSPFKDNILFYNVSTETWEGVDVNGTFHLSISKPLHNSRVLSVTPCENPSTYWCGTYNYYDNNYTSQGYNTTDDEITKLCTQDPDGYQDSGVRYPVSGFQKNIAYVESDGFDELKGRNYWQNKNEYAGGSLEVFNSHVRLDDSLTELCLEMFYFIDEDLQEEFYCVFRTNQMFGRKAPANNNFYQTLMFVKMPGYPIMCTSTIYESTNNVISSNATKLTSKVQTDVTTGVKYLVNYGVNNGNVFNITNYINGGDHVNMSTTEDVSAEFNPRWDAPDTTPDLWVHHAVAQWNPQWVIYSSGYNKNNISGAFSSSYNRRHTMKVFGKNTYFYHPYFKTTVNDVEHTIYAATRYSDNFGSYEFLYDQSCSSETGTSLLVPIQRQHQYKMWRNGPRHCKWYNMFYTTPEKVVTPTKDDVSLTWKCYPCKRRSIQGYVNFLAKEFTYINSINPVSKAADPWYESKNTYNNATTPKHKYWFTEDITSSTPGQPILSDCQVGAELDASGFEGFALDYSEYSADKVETVDL